MKKSSYPTCPSCGSSDFKIDGYVGYVQPYNARTGEYEMSEMIWEEDIAAAARCAGCDRDATGLLKKAGVLAFYEMRLRKR
jgi:hypothetical protein